MNDPKHGAITLQEELLSCMVNLLHSASDTATKSLEASTNNYTDLVNTEGFEFAIAGYSKTIELLALHKEIVAVSESFLLAKRAHMSGEYHFFNRSYSQAAGMFSDAVSFVKVASTVSGNSPLLVELKRSIHSYQIYFKIEEIEALAYAASESGNCAYALSLHEKEFELTRAAVHSGAKLDSFLAGFFMGHLHFANSNILRCQSQIQRALGNNKDADEIAVLASESEALSMQVNPQWSRSK